MPLNINFQQILLHLFNFVLLFGILYYFLYKPVKDFMEKRREGYEIMKQDAENDRAEAKQMKEEYEQKLSDAEKESAAMMAENVHKIEAERERIIAEANEQADEIVSKAHVKAEADAEIIKNQTKNEIASYVTEMAEKIVLDSEADAMEKFFAAASQPDNKEA